MGKSEEAKMTEREQELLSAAAAIDAACLEQAAAAVAEGCRELSCWAGIFSRRLKGLSSEEAHTFTRALSLTMLGHLPARPATCPFCIQYGRDRSCSGCGYAATHGRCDEDTSAFSVFIEAFLELGRIIYQDAEGRPVQMQEASAILGESISMAQARAGRMAEDVQGLSPGQECRTVHLMLLKARYIEDMIGLLPLRLLSSEAMRGAQQVKDALRDYW